MPVRMTTETQESMDFMLSLLKCVKCEKMPRHEIWILESCTHKYCADCIYNLKDEKCVSCKVESQLPDRSVDQFTTKLLSQLRILEEQLRGNVSEVLAVLDLEQSSQENSVQVEATKHTDEVESVEISPAENFENGDTELFNQSTPQVNGKKNSSTQRPSESFSDIFNDSEAEIFIAPTPTHNPKSATSSNRKDDKSTPHSRNKTSIPVPCNKSTPINNNRNEKSPPPSNKSDKSSSLISNATLRRLFGGSQDSSIHSQSQSPAHSDSKGVESPFATQNSMPGSSDTQRYKYLPSTPEAIAKLCNDNDRSVHHDEILLTPPILTQYSKQNTTCSSKSDEEMSTFISDGGLTPTECTRKETPVEEMDVDPPTQKVRFHRLRKKPVRFTPTDDDSKVSPIKEKVSPVKPKEIFRLGRVTKKMKKVASSPPPVIVESDEEVSVSEEEEKSVHEESVSEEEKSIEKISENEPVKKNKFFLHRSTKHASQSSQSRKKYLAKSLKGRGEPKKAFTYFNKGVKNTRKVIAKVGAKLSIRKEVTKKKNEKSNVKKSTTSSNEESEQEKSPEKLLETPRPSQVYTFRSPSIPVKKTSESRRVPKVSIIKLDSKQMESKSKRKRGGSSSDHSSVEPPVIRKANSADGRKKSVSSAPTRVSVRNKTSEGTLSVAKTSGSSYPGPSSSTRTDRKSMGKRNAKGELPLHVCARLGQLDKATKLIERGADVDAADHGGWTALHEAVNGQNALSMVKLLCKSGCDVNALGLNNETALHLAARNGDHKIVSILLSSYSASPNIRNSCGKLPRDVAGSDNVMKLFDEKTIVSLENSDQSRSRGGGEMPVEMRIVLQKAVFYFACESSKDFVGKCKDVLGMKIVNELKKEVTHVVFDAKRKEKVLLTLNYLLAMMSGCWMLSVEWLRDSLAERKFVDPRSYELPGCLYEGEGDSEEEESPVMKTRVNREHGNPGLFHGMNFYVYKNTSWTGIENSSKTTSSRLTLKKKEIASLVKAGDGTVINREPNPDTVDPLEYPTRFHASQESGKPDSKFVLTSHVTLFDEKNVPPKKHDLEHVKSLRIEWLVDSAVNFDLLHPDSYLD